MERLPKHYDLDGVEVDAIVAGLRVLQNTWSLGKFRLPSGIEMIFTNGNKGQGLSLEEIDNLCKRLNCGE